MKFKKATYATRKHLGAKEVRIVGLKALRIFLFLIFCANADQAATADVYRCAEPKGAVMYSAQNHTVAPDGFTGVEPVAIIEGKEMRVVWGDTKKGPGQENVWKAVVIHESQDSISAVSLSEGSAGSALMLFTIDRKRNFLYMSSHKDAVLLNTSGASMYVSKCKH